jgi:primary-amine oxidase
MRETKFPHQAPSPHSQAAAIATIAACLVLAGCGTREEPAVEQLTAHPLDGLSVDEIGAVVETLRASGHFDAAARLHIINLQEPPKADVLAWHHGDAVTRTASVVISQGIAKFEGTVDIAHRTVTSWREITESQPNLLNSEVLGGGEALKRNAEWQAAMRLRGITEYTDIDCAAVSPGFYGIAEEAGRRVGRAWCYDARDTSNFWGRPIEGLSALVDLETLEVLKVIDTGAVPIPDAPVEYDRGANGRVRELPTSISVAQPEGVSFTVAGHEVSWQNWGFHFRMDPRVGLVVSGVAFTDGGTERSVLYEGSLSELFVPYMDPDLGWYWRTYMDAGEFLAGVNSVTLQLGVDCPGNARYFDFAFADEAGRPQVNPRAACLFERDAGDVAWRHTESGVTETRKKRDLVLRSVSTIGNYDYTFEWTFQQDGTIRIGVGASGIEQVKAVASRAAPDAGAQADTAYGRFVGEHTVAVNHDHFFSFRLDLDVDGITNSFVADRLVTESLPDTHPRKSIWVIDSETAQTEHEAKLRINLERPALWRIVSANNVGPLGYPTSYQIKPGANAVSLMTPDDFPQRRAGFTDYHLWVTPQRDTERYAAGNYPVQSQGGDGLPAWTGADRPIENTDLVVWYTVGLHHVVRAEDWPVLPTSWLSFELRPFDFFAQNPALDLPPGTR